MAINTLHVGKKYFDAPEPVFLVESAHIRKFALAVGDTNPYYFDEEKARQSPHPGIIAPPMFAVVYQREVVNRFLNDPELSINLAKLVHWEQIFEFPRPVYVGDRLRSEGEIIDIVPKPGLDLVTLNIITFNQKQEVVCRAQWIIFIRH